MNKSIRGQYKRASFQSEVNLLLFKRVCALAFSQLPFTSVLKRVFVRNQSYLSSIYTFITSFIHINLSLLGRFCTKTRKLRLF